MGAASFRKIASIHLRHPLNQTSKSVFFPEFQGQKDTAATRFACNKKKVCARRILHRESRVFSSQKKILCDLENMHSGDAEERFNKELADQALLILTFDVSRSYF